MSVIYEERLSDSPFVECIWRSRSESDEQLMSSADGRWDMVVMRQGGQANLSLWGPMSKAAPISYAAGLECIGMRFKLGTFMPALPLGNLLEVGTNLPGASSQSFWLHSATWQFPDFENADTFVDRLVHDGLLVHDEIVDAVLQERPPSLSIRSVRRRFSQATGLPQVYIRQIERARRAVALLQQGVSISDTVYETGYADQPHLTRSLKHFIGQTPARIARMNRSG